jgi:hypothetical protein
VDGHLLLRGEDIDMFRADDIKANNKVSSEIIDDVYLASNFCLHRVHRVPRLSTREEDISNYIFCGPNFIVTYTSDAYWFCLNSEYEVRVVVLKPHFPSNSKYRACVYTYFYYVVARYIEYNLVCNVMPYAEAVTGADVTGCIYRGADYDRLRRY